MRLPPSHSGCLQSGVSGDETLHANRAALKDCHLRPQRPVDVSTPDLSTTLLGEQFSSPVGLAPVCSQNVFHRDAEAAVARAAKSQNHLQILSIQTKTPPDKVNEARGKPDWFQLCESNVFYRAQQRIKRAEEAGCPVPGVTVEPVGQRVPETRGILRRSDTRNCAMCHGGTMLQEKARFLPMYRDFDLTGVTNPMDPEMIWDKLGRLRDTTSMKVVVKGLLSGQDAAIAVRRGFDGIVVSNHGGRADEAGLVVIDALPEVIREVNGAVPVIVDSGFRRGADIVKALCMGADAVCVGRLYIRGLAVFGQKGVERVLQLLDAETMVMMRQTGANRREEPVP
nr:alpha-hydroxy acid oxidase [Roseobacter ponti]